MNIHTRKAVINCFSKVMVTVPIHGVLMEEGFTCWCLVHRDMWHFETTLEKYLNYAARAKVVYSLCDEEKEHFREIYEFYSTKTRKELQLPYPVSLIQNINVFDWTEQNKGLLSMAVFDQPTLHDLLVEVLANKDLPTANPVLLESVQNRWYQQTREDVQFCLTHGGFQALREHPCLQVFILMYRQELKNQLKNTGTSLYMN